MSLKKLVDTLDLKDPEILEYLKSGNIPVALEIKNIRKMADEIKLITPVMEKIFSRFSRPEYRGQEIRIYNPEGEVEFFLTQDRYLWYMYQSFMRLIRQNPTVPTLVEILYLLVMDEIGDSDFIRKVCTGQLTLHTTYVWTGEKLDLTEDEIEEYKRKNPDTEEYEWDSEVLPHPENKEELEIYEKKLSQKLYQLHTKVNIKTVSRDFFGLNSKDFNLWVDEYLARLLEGCKFNSLILSSFSGTKLTDYPLGGGHQTILFSYVREDKRIYFTHYDPNGTLGDDSSLSTGIEKFIRSIIFMLELKGYKATLIPSVATSCYIGPQQAGEKYDKQGFCVMYSLFWLYCVVSIMAKVDLNKIKNFPKLLGSVDRFLIFNTERLHSVLINFTKFLSNGYIESQDEPYRKYLTENIERLIIIDQLGDDQHAGYLPRNPETPIPSEFIAQRDEDKRRAQIERRATRKTTRKRPGSPCKTDRECFSDQCIDNVCSDFGN